MQGLRSKSKALILTLQRKYWKIKLSSVENKLIFYYNIKNPAKYRSNMTRLAFCRRLIGSSLEDFAATKQIIVPVYKTVKY